MSGVARPVVLAALAALASELRDDHVEVAALATTLIRKGSFTEREWLAALGAARGSRFCR